MRNSRIRVSDEAVQKATGRTWAEWFRILNDEGAAKMSHKEIARFLQDSGYIENGWWCQTVTVGYEYARGRRVIGQTESAGYEIGVQKTLPVSPEEAWKIVTESAGREIWLGSVLNAELVTGQTYQTAEGIKGEIRSIAPGKRLRLTWQPLDWNKPSTLQITIVPSGNKTSIRFHQEKLSDQEKREKMRKYWKQVLGQLEYLIKKKDN